MKSQQRKQKQEKKGDLGLCIYEMPVVRFEADILAAQDFDRIYRSRPRSPERDLMLAILEEALNDYQRCFRARDHKGREALRRRPSVDYEYRRRMDFLLHQLL